MQMEGKVHHGSISPRYQHQGMHFAVNAENMSACERLLQKPQILPTCGPISDSSLSVGQNHTEKV